MPDAFCVRYRDESGTYRKQRFVPRETAPGWLRIEKEWTGCRWRFVGQEIVTDLVAIELAT